MRAVDSAASLRAAMLDLSWCDVVLLDTAGRSHRDARRIGEIAGVLGAATPDETHLVLCGTASAAAQREAARAFQAVRPTRVVLSKLDECVHAAALVGALRESRCPASWFATGQEVPDDLERANGAALAERVVADAEAEA
jgi:flagellar biosynthesis protein FlhF